MNAIAKAIVQNLSIEGRISSAKLVLSNFRVLFLAIAIMISALALIYIKDLNRCLFIDYQGLQQKNSEISIDYGRLLLEHGTWAAQGRIQSIATTSLHMVIPSSSSMVMFKL